MKSISFLFCFLPQDGYFLQPEVTTVQHHVCGTACGCGCRSGGGCGCSSLARNQVANFKQVRYIRKKLPVQATVVKEQEKEKWNSVSINGKNYNVFGIVKDGKINFKSKDNIVEVK